MSVRTMCGAGLEPELKALRRPGVHQVSVKLLSFAADKEGVA